MSPAAQAADLLNWILLALATLTALAGLYAQRN